MLKKLDKLILRAFIGPFIATFFIAFFVIMMQHLWKYVDDLVGKGIDLLTIGQFLWYASASLLTLAMPIAILISSIMTFGNLGESFELVAIKSSGISLLRFMRPLIIVSMILCGITFLIANYVIPVANLKFITLYNDIYYKKPAFVLKEGIFFTHIPNYAIKIGKKDDDGKGIKEVLIYEQTNPLQDNMIVAEKGEMKISDDKNFLEFNLANGVRYQEKGNFMDSSTEYIRLGFKEFKKSFDLSILQKQTTNDSVFRNNYKMLSARQLDRNIDSLSVVEDSLRNRFKSGIKGYLNYSRITDSSWKNTKVVNNDPVPFNDSIINLLSSPATSKLMEIRNTLQFSSADFEQRHAEIRFHKVEWHRKFSLSLACLVLFFIGAPLGSIIRKGGLGLPLVVAIIFFLFFHLLNVFGEKFVKENLTSPFTGMWLAVIILVPIGIFLTYKAMHDSQLFNKEYYNRTFKRFSVYLHSVRPGNKPLA
ncbi:MAG: LptF/LptG family permease [Ferruginibacter sp.]